CGCEYSAFGCCPDNETVARGKDDAGCGCQYTEYGCCPDDHTPAAGEDYSGCPCNTYPYGCCPDGVSIARGLNAVGCGCEYGEFGCCEDGRTPATGPGKEGCGCEASEFGCCPDGVTPATGKFFDGCQDEAPVIPGEVCGYEKDRGPCADYIVKWYFDMEYGGCTRFWYGGCDGNLNKFETQNECIAACVEPEGMGSEQKNYFLIPKLSTESCHLPLVEGPCTGSVPSWYHDSASGSCKPFVYGGCLGNNNRYGSKEECEEMCVIPEKTDVCLLEVMPGPCRGNYTRWFYDQTLGICSQFAFGGCKGNGNNFLTENECMQSCIRGRSKGLCTLPKASGLCEETLPRWYYDYSETRCMPFYYTGCDGNSNRFITRGECEATCPGDITEPEEDVCSLPSSTGDCNNFEERWFFDLSENQCKSFVYGGCGGNNNNFASYEFCEKRCGSKKEIALEKEFNT
ncbi:Papilin-like 2, partial [Homarus americanus]